VTGGAGFIGSHIVQALLDRGAAVHVLDNLSTGKRDNVPREASFIQGDILDAGELDRALNGVDAVIHLAARVAIRDSLKNFHQDASTNLMGTLHLLKQAGSRQVRNLIFASSMAVYADSLQPAPLAENYQLNPISPYGISKLAAEKYTRLLAGPLGMKSVCLRYFNVYGPRQTFTLYVGVINIFIERLLKGQAPVIFGDGEQQRDFVHVEDITRATLLALESDIDGEVFNVGSGVGTSVAQIARLLIDRIRPGTQPIYDRPHPVEIRNSIADISQIRVRLGYAPRATLAEKIDEVIAWKRKTAGG